MAGQDHGRSKVSTFVHRILHRSTHRLSSSPVPEPAHNVVEIRMARSKYTEDDFKQMKDFATSLGGTLDPRYADIEDVEFNVWDPRYKGRDDMMALFNFPLDDAARVDGSQDSAGRDFGETVKALQAYPGGVIYVLVHVKSDG
ncbi:hypothetical protein BJ508DRAFT_322591 [Ascobolus immersus RN42]|uniref:Uncharacterized protein n=1 Tax=Ascobolus immersus RN42 TaxID=1160509 RepID=A0A3N4IVB4_ASCIM|nr:hypothetical protein BJ508DRAFT_322591 [Ascobolus immersus RN42]